MADGKKPSRQEEFGSQTQRHPRVPVPGRDGDAGKTRGHAPLRGKTVRHPRVAPPPPPLPEPPPFVPPPSPRKARPKRRKRRRGAFARLVRSAVGLVSLAALGVGLAAIVYTVFPPPRTNILVLGVDARPGQGYVTRTDTIMLVTVDPAQPYVGMLSIPRDLNVDVPGYGYRRINTAHVYGENETAGRGMELAAQTVANNFGVPVHRVLRMNFQGFVAIVDAAGGVDIDVPARLYDGAYPTENYGTIAITFEPGLQHMDGERALQYARTRHSSNDFMRAARQQEVMVALVRRLSNPLNWWRLPAVYAAFASNVETDLTVVDAVLLAPAVVRVGPGHFEREVLSRENSMVVNANIPGDPYLLAPNWPLVNPLIDEMFRR